MLTIHDDYIIDPDAAVAVCDGCDRAFATDGYDATILCDECSDAPITDDVIGNLGLYLIAKFAMSVHPEWRHSNVPDTTLDNIFLIRRHYNGVWVGSADITTSAVIL